MQNIKKIKLNLLFTKDFTEIKKIKLDKIFDYIEIKRINLINFKFNKEKKKINYPIKFVFLNEIKKIKLNFHIKKKDIDKLFNKYSNNLFIVNNKEYILNRFDIYFESYLLNNKEDRKKLISDLNKFLYWIDQNNFYYTKQIDSIEYKTFWRL